jgi:Leucine-rich repeat (LRR) protein
LTWLNLRGTKIRHLSCFGFNQEEAKKIARFGTSLESLHLRISSFKESSRDISQHSFLQVVRSCTGLVSLNLERLRLTTATMSVIAECCTAINILKYCNNMDLTDASVLKLAKSNPELNSLTILPPLSGALDASFIMQFVGNCPMLTSLNLSDNRLTDTIVCAITQSCTGLIRFDISRNYGITDVSLFNLAENFKQLQTLNASYNNKLEKASLFSLAKGCGQIRSLDLSECKIELANKSILIIGKLLEELLELTY